jgi:hypothetical protein
MTTRTPSEHAGKTVTICADVAGLGGQQYRVEDWWINVGRESWMFSANAACFAYAARSAAAKLPIDDEVLYGKVDGLGHLVHISEIEATS